MAGWKSGIGDPKLCVLQYLRLKTSRYKHAFNIILIKTFVQNTAHKQ